MFTVFGVTIVLYFIKITKPGMFTQYDYSHISSFPLTNQYEV